MKTKVNLLKILMVAVLFFFAINASEAMKISITGPGKISGNIRSAVSDSPLECITITLFSANDSSMVAGTISDNYGNFYISMLEPGNYFLEISEHGFEPQQIKDLSVKTGKTKICLNEIQLKPLETPDKKHGKLFKIKL